MFDMSFESVTYMTQAEFARWVRRREASVPWDSSRYELMNGRIVMNPPAGYPHGRIDQRLLQLLGNHIVDGGRGVVFGSSQGFALPSGDTVQPDAAVILAERWSEPPPLADGGFVALVPDLVVEIVSPGNASYDRGEKKGIYERNGVREYWLLEAHKRHVRVFHLEVGRYGTGTIHPEDEPIGSIVLPDLDLRLGQLLP